MGEDALAFRDAVPPARRAVQGSLVRADPPRSMWARIWIGFGATLHHTQSDSAIKRAASAAALDIKGRPNRL
jgi:hypothetical protein